MLESLEHRTLFTVTVASEFATSLGTYACATASATAVAATPAAGAGRALSGYDKMISELNKAAEAREEQSGWSLSGSVVGGPLVGTQIGSPIGGAVRPDGEVAATSEVDTMRADPNDATDNWYIQDLMSDYNKSQSLADSILKKGGGRDPDGGRLPGTGYPSGAGGEESSSGVADDGPSDMAAAHTDRPINTANLGDAEQPSADEDAGPEAEAVAEDVVEDEVTEPAITEEAEPVAEEDQADPAAGEPEAPAEQGEPIDDLLWGDALDADAA
jgi:hypothetical protein